MYSIEPIQQDVLVQAPRVIKDQAFCKNFENLGSFDSIETCWTNVEAAQVEGGACENANNTFAFDPANNGWCSCCTMGTVDALKKPVTTRDVECKIYKNDADKTREGATVWNG